MDNHDKPKVEVQQVDAEAARLLRGAMEELIEVTMTKQQARAILSALGVPTISLLSGAEIRQLFLDVNDGADAIRSTLGES